MADKDEKIVENPEESSDFDFGKKKKKKKPVKELLKEEETPEAPAAAASITIEAETQNKLQELDLNQQPAATASTAEASADVVEDDFKNLKKKARKGVKFEDDESGIDFKSSVDIESKIEPINDSQSGWLGSERDYTYEELLERVFNIMKEKNPDMVTGEKKRFVMRPPHVARVGTKRTSFTNFGEICRLLKREEKHLLNYLLAELGTSGSLDINTQLIIKGRFSQKQIENVLRRYIKEYITCHSCKSPDTHLVKNERIFFLQCEACQSRVSVASIKSGFQAQVAKRAAQRARAT